MLATNPLRFAYIIPGELLNKSHFPQTTVIHGSLVIRPMGVSVPCCTRLDKCDVEGFGWDLDRCEDCMESFSPFSISVLHSLELHLRGP